VTTKKSASSGDQTIASNPTHESRIPVSLRCLQAHLFVWLTAAIGLFADLGSKHWAVQTIGDPGPIIAGDPNAKNLEPIVLISPDYLVLETWHNPGAVWGVGANKNAFLVATSVIALGFLFYLFATTRANQRLGHIALGMLFAGALGNLYDRVFNDGNVIDFIVVDLGFWPLDPWPTFNIADALLCIGVALLLISYYRTHKKLAAASRATSQTES
jgi:lipoprotein signal peptidase